MGGIRGNNIIQGPKSFFSKKNTSAKVHGHSDIYFGCSGDFCFVSKFFVVFCGRSCHGNGSRIHKALLYLMQKVRFVPLFIKLLGVCVKESVANQAPRGGLNINQVLSILFWSHSCICCLYINAIHMHTQAGKQPNNALQERVREKENNIHHLVYTILLYRDYTLREEITQG